MKSIKALLLGVGAAFLGTGCFHHTPVKAVQVDDPGVHVVAASTSTSVVWYDGKANRACTIQGGGKGGAHGGKYSHMGAPAGAGAGHGGMLDSVLFRLCEARGNGDISAAQYSAAVQKLTKTFERAVASAHGPMFEKRIKMFHGGPGAEGACPFAGDGGCPFAKDGGCPHATGEGGCPHCGSCDHGECRHAKEHAGDHAIGGTAVPAKAAHPGWKAPPAKAAPPAKPAPPVAPAAKKP